MTDFLKKIREIMIYIFCKYFFLIMIVLPKLPIHLTLKYLHIQ